MLFLVYRFFFQLLVRRSGPSHRKVLLTELLTRLRIMEFGRECINDWVTRRNTIINSSKSLPEGTENRRHYKRKKKSVKFVCENNEEILFNCDGQPVTHPPPEKLC
jgi:hypothetical protein